MSPNAGTTKSICSDHWRRGAQAVAHGTLADVELALASRRVFEDFLNDSGLSVSLDGNRAVHDKIRISRVSCGLQSRGPVPERRRQGLPFAPPFARGRQLAPTPFLGNLGRQATLLLQHRGCDRATLRKLSGVRLSPSVPRRLSEHGIGTTGNLFDNPYCLPRNVAL